MKMKPMVKGSVGIRTAGVKMAAATGRQAAQTGKLPSPGMQRNVIGRPLKKQAGLLQKIRKPSPLPPVPSAPDSAAFSAPYAALSAAIAGEFALSLASQGRIYEGLGVDTSVSLLPVLAFFPLGLAATLSLQKAAESDRLGSLTYVRLNLALLAWESSTLLNWLLQPDAVADPALTAAKVALALPTLAICSAALLGPGAPAIPAGVDGEDDDGAVPDPDEDEVEEERRSYLEAGGVKALLGLCWCDLKKGVRVWDRRTGVGKYLAATGVLNLAVGGSFAFSPRVPIPIKGGSFGLESAGIHLYRTEFGLAQLFMLTVFVFLLADAADRGRTGTDTVRRLHLGTFACTALISASTLAGIDPSSTTDQDLIPNIVSAGAIGIATSFVYLYHALFGKSEEVESA